MHDRASFWDGEVRPGVEQVGGEEIVAEYVGHSDLCQACGCLVEALLPPVYASPKGVCADDADQVGLEVRA